jgi:hypothetical protein
MKTGILTSLAFLAVTVAANAQSDKPLSVLDRRLHIEGAAVRCEGETENEYELKPSAYFIKNCQGKHSCGMRIYFSNPEICSKGKKYLVATVRCGTEEKGLSWSGRWRHKLVCNERQFTIDGK